VAWSRPGAPLRLGNRRESRPVSKKIPLMRFFCGSGGTPPRVGRYAVRIVTFCPPALAIHDMSPDAPTSPPPRWRLRAQIFPDPSEPSFRERGNPCSAGAEHDGSLIPAFG
jgi:hypothetical protein